MVARLIPDFGLDALPLAVSSLTRTWPGPGPGEMVPSGLVPGAPPHIRGLSSFCYGLPLVPGDVVETVPLDSTSGRGHAEHVLTWMVAGMPGQEKAEQKEKQNRMARRGKKARKSRRRQQGWNDFGNTNVYAPVVLTHVRALVPGVLAVIEGCAEQSRREIAGPGVSGNLVPYGYAPEREDGIVEEWWVDVESVFAAAGCDVLDTDGDRIFAFWGGAGLPRHREGRLSRRRTPCGEHPDPRSRRPGPRNQRVPGDGPGPAPDVRTRRGGHTTTTPTAQGEHQWSTSSCPMSG